MQPLVSIITVNYNQIEVTLSFLQSLADITYKNTEIFVVDNASQTDPTILIKELYPEVEVIVSKENLGFAGGNNLALKKARGKYVMFLNNDTIVTHCFLDPLVKVAENNPKVGICSSKLNFYSNPDLIQFAGSSPLHPFKIQSFAYGYAQKDEGQFNETKETALAHGAAMLVRMEAINKVGPMPEDYFLYYEEIDWCEKIKKAGYKIMFVADSLVFHKVSVSIGKKNFTQVYYKTRNRILFTKKWKSGIPKMVALVYLTMVMFKDYYKYKKEKKRDLAYATWYGWKWNLKN
jgi:GT2 family glycosyltransferase